MQLILFLDNHFLLITMIRLMNRGIELFLFVGYIMILKFILRLNWLKMGISGIVREILREDMDLVIS